MGLLNYPYKHYGGAKFGGLGTTIVSSTPKNDSVPEFSLIGHALNSLKPTTRKNGSCVKMHSC